MGSQGQAVHRWMGWQVVWVTWLRGVQASHAEPGSEEKTGGLGWLGCCTREKKRACIGDPASLGSKSRDIFGRSRFGVVRVVQSGRPYGLDVGLSNLVFSRSWLVDAHVAVLVHHAHRHSQRKPDRKKKN